MKVKKYIFWLTVLVTFTAFASIANAEENVLGNGVTDTSFSNHIIDYGRVIYGTLIVFIILGILIFLAKKTRINSSGKYDLIEVVNSHAISTKDKLLVIRAGQEYLLIGVSNAGMNKLHTLSMNEIEQNICKYKSQTKNFSSIYATTIGKIRNA